MCTPTIMTPELMRRRMQDAANAYRALSDMYDQRMTQLRALRDGLIGVRQLISSGRYHDIKSHLTEIDMLAREALKNLNEPVLPRKGQPMPGPFDKVIGR